MTEIKRKTSSWSASGRRQKRAHKGHLGTHGKHVDCTQSVAVGATFPFLLLSLWFLQVPLASCLLPLASCLLPRAYRLLFF